jgi:hypothetical protein
VPLYRVFRGFRKADLSPGQFYAEIQNRFIPAAPSTHAKNGLVAYLPGLSPLRKAADIPDELAIVASESAEVYQKARNTPEGQAYADLHWEVFDKERSKSTSAVPFEATVQSDVGYDVMQSPTDWQKGHSTLFIGLRKADVSAETFLAQLSEHVAQVKKTLGSGVLKGYIVIANENYEIAYQNWSSKNAMQRAFSAPQGQALGAEAGRLMNTLQWSEAVPFAGKIGPGQLVNARFQRRAPNQ